MAPREASFARLVALRVPEDTTIAELKSTLVARQVKRAGRAEERDRQQSRRPRLRRQQSRPRRSG